MGNILEPFFKCCYSGTRLTVEICISIVWYHQAVLSFASRVDPLNLLSLVPPVVETKLGLSAKRCLVSLLVLHPLEGTGGVIPRK